MNMIHQGHRRQRFRLSRSRGGFGLVPVIAVFAVAVTTCALWTKFSIRQQLDQRLSEDRTQAVWLADAALRRGAARRAIDPDFTGETWVVAGEQIGRPSAATVTIHLEAVDGAPDSVRISARTTYPEDRPRVTVSRSVVFTPPSTESPS
jgi:hypothetical protein